MATPAEIQAQLDATQLKARIVSSVRLDDTTDSHCVKVWSRGGSGYRPNRAKWVDTTAAQTAAQQATTITNAIAT